jgi:hypothetical protein
VHTGTLYAKADVSGLFAAISQLLRDGVLKAGELELVFMGGAMLPEGKTLTELILVYDLSSIVRKIDFSDHADALRAQRDSDVLLIIQPHSSLQVPAKTYEYLAADRPILAIVDDGATADLVRSTRSGIVAAPTDIDGIARGLLALCRAARNGWTGPDPLAVVRYREPAITASLAAELDAVAAKRVPDAG